MPKINDFVVRFANVNGTGSASANYLFAKSIFRMGIPVSPKNIFPSNIQGLPTWYEVRVSERGYLGRREGIDVMVSVNPQSMTEDIRSVLPGGYFIYDSTKPLHEEMIRADITYLGIPFMEKCNEEYTDPRLRQLFKNVMYVGALSALLKIEFDVLQQIIEEQFAGKLKVIAPNIKALQLGIDYVHQNFSYPLDVHLERRDLVGNQILTDGNSACGLGAVYAGATVCAWYPITPSTSVAEGFEMYAEKLRVDEDGKNNYAIVQAEDELAAIGMVIGANWNGARGFTATSGPGVSLMNEFLGLAYFAEIPSVLIDVQRTGPSTGMPTRTQQSDLTLAAYASHGDTKHPMIFPCTPLECFELTAASFDLADIAQTPVMVMTDLDLGMNDHMSAPFTWDDARVYNKGKIMSAEQLNEIGRYGRYLDVDDDGVGHRTIPGVHPTKGAFVARGTSRDEYAVYTEESPAYKRNMDRLTKKWETIKTLVPQPEVFQTKNNSNVGVIFFGTTSQSAVEAADMLTADGVVIDKLRLLAFPFGKAVVDFIAQHETIIVVEQNRDAQMRSLMITELNEDPKKFLSVLNYDGLPITADFIYRSITNQLNPTLATS
ncbi:MAG: 2-oxoacid:acceptor oxidoreductase subunit alpha [Ignavibacteria bacterium]|nr:2-oxoacid:acceptor oxidoreductase subunit alpha [Ignavibacteria bacterium]